jgi:hypothetical protein
MTLPNVLPLPVDLREQLSRQVVLLGSFDGLIV